MAAPSPGTSSSSSSAQGDLSLLESEAAQALLSSKIPARLAYTWRDGSPRVVPIWFHWDAAESTFVLVSPAQSPKVAVLQERPDVALTIDEEGFPPRVLTVRGRAEVSVVTGIPEEYAAAARRYFGDEMGTQWVAGMPADMASARIVVRPTWVGLLDFQTRLPSALGGIH